MSSQLHQNTTDNKQADKKVSSLVERSGRNQTHVVFKDSDIERSIGQPQDPSKSLAAMLRVFYDLIVFTPFYCFRTIVIK
jgi:hypothetical protein